MAIELRMKRREKLFDSEDPFFIDNCPVTMQPSSLVLSEEKWRELGEPEDLIVILEDAHRDDRTDTHEIPVITGESEVVERIVRRPCPVDPSHPEDAHAPGGSWYGVPHGR